MHTNSPCSIYAYIPIDSNTAASWKFKPWKRRDTKTLWNGSLWSEKSSNIWISNKNWCRTSGTLASCDLRAVFVNAWLRKTPWARDHERCQLHWIIAVISRSLRLVRRVSSIPYRDGTMYHAVSYVPTALIHVGWCECRDKGGLRTAINHTYV